MKSEDIINKIVYKYSNAVNKAIDDYCLKVFSTPDWITKRLWIYRWYGKMKRFEIRRFMNEPDLLEFYVKNKKVGTMKINSTFLP